MWVFRVILVAVFVCLAIYMIQVITNHGLGLFSVFFGDVAKLGWAGQFNADFMAILGLFCRLGSVAQSIFFTWNNPRRDSFFWWRAVSLCLSTVSELLP